MRKRILISPNSFKECADSVTIAELIKNNLSYLRDTELIVKPITDGGDGFLSVCKFHFDGELRTYSISTAYDNSTFDCPILYCENRKEIYIESAEVLGLKVVPLQYRNPLKLSSNGSGELLKKIEQDVQIKRIKVDKVFIGIGGTATIDMGVGMMSELGLKLLDSTNAELRVLPENFLAVRTIEYKPFNFSFEVIPVVDVTNPLVGERGGVKMFGRQKGAEDKAISILENSFNHLLKLFENNRLQFSHKKLSGAGGGLPAAFQIFYTKPLLYSSEFIQYNLGFKEYSDSDNIDYLITGEGAYDHQSGFGKGVGTLIYLFDSKVKQIFLVCGRISKDSVSSLPEYVLPIELNKYFSSDDKSILNYREGLEKACQNIVKQLNF